MNIVFGTDGWRARIAEDYEGRDLVLVSILKGALPFLADLMREIPIYCALDFLEVSSYGAGTTSTGVVRILKDLAKPIYHRFHVTQLEVYERLTGLEDIAATRARWAAYDRPGPRARAIAQKAAFAVADETIGFGQFSSFSTAR